MEGYIAELERTKQAKTEPAPAPPAPPAPPPPIAEPPPLVGPPTIAATRGTSDDAAPVYTRWWFWAAVAGVAVAGIGTALLLSRDEGPTHGGIGALDLRDKGPGRVASVGTLPALSPHILTLPSARLLVVQLGAPHEVVSWAIVNGGRRRATSVAWREVRRGELGRPDRGRRDAHAADPRRAGDAPGRRIADRARRSPLRGRARGARRVEAACVATVGLGNLLAVGDPPAAETARVGTINVVCRVSVGLTEEALIEACALAAEARTAAVLAAGLRSPLSARPAPGTGTDCIVVAAPSAARRERPFAGKHTACGAALGAAVFGAVGRGVARWMEENRPGDVTSDVTILLGRARLRRRARRAPGAPAPGRLDGQPAEGAAPSCPVRPLPAFLWGAFMALLGPIGFGGLTWLALHHTHGVVRWSLAVFLLKSAFAVRALAAAGWGVSRPLAAGDLTGAASALGSLVSRDTTSPCRPPSSPPPRWSPSPRTPPTPSWPRCSSSPWPACRAPSPTAPSTPWTP